MTTESFIMRVRYEEVWAGKYFVKMIMPAPEAIVITHNSDRIAPFSVRTLDDETVYFTAGNMTIEHFVTVKLALECAQAWSEERFGEPGWICNAFGNRVQRFGEE